MKEVHRLRIERALKGIDTLRVGGMKLAAYAQSRNEALSYWRTQLSWEQRWRQMLNGTYTKAKARAAFVRATPRQDSHAVKGKPPSPQHSTQAQTAPCIVIDIQGAALQASVQWPLHELTSSSAWLREVLA
jgi:hypothetical protein